MVVTTSDTPTGWLDTTDLSNNSAALSRRKQYINPKKGLVLLHLLSSTVVARVASVVKRVNEGISRASEPLPSYSPGGGFRLISDLYIPKGGRRDNLSRFAVFVPVGVST